MKTKAKFEKKESFKASWAEMLTKAVTEPGMIHKAYGMFHGYSLGNQMLAAFQCAARGIEPGPIATFNRWKELGRIVKKGEKALALCMPVTCKRRSADATTEQASQDQPEDTQQTGGVFQLFVFKNNWFVLSQTEGEAYTPEPLADWNEAQALAALEITKVPFTHPDGNVQGFAQAGRKIAVSSIAAMPHKTLFHEIAHVLLHQPTGEMSDTATVTQDVKELEAEAVAMLCCESLNLPGAEYSRGYIQSWYKGQTIPEKTAQRIFSTADKILKAGRISQPAQEPAAAQAEPESTDEPTAAAPAADAPEIAQEPVAIPEPAEPVEIAQQPATIQPAPAPAPEPIPAYVAAAASAPGQQSLFF